jgi:hypothetical protein
MKGVLLSYPPDFYSLSVMLAYFALFIAPVIINVTEDRKWKSLQSAI